MTGAAADGLQQVVDGLANRLGRSVAVDDAHGRVLAQAGQLVRHHGDAISTIVGRDSLALPAFCDGVAGAMCGSANVIGAELVSVHRAVVDGDLARARAEWERIYPLLDTLLSTAFIPGVKAALAARGLPVGPPREPLSPLAGEALARVESLVGALPEPAVAS